MSSVYARCGKRVSNFADATFFSKESYVRLVSHKHP